MKKTFSALALSGVVLGAPAQSLENFSQPGACTPCHSAPKAGQMHISAIDTKTCFAKTEAAIGFELRADFGLRERERIMRRLNNPATVPALKDDEVKEALRAMSSPGALQYVWTRSADGKLSKREEDFFKNCQIAIARRLAAP